MTGVVNVEPGLAPLIARAAPNAIRMAFEVVLLDPGARVIEVVRQVRDLTGSGIGEAKALLEQVPRTLKRTPIREEAEHLKRQLEVSGAVVEI